MDSEVTANVLSQKKLAFDRAKIHLAELVPDYVSQYPGLAGASGTPTQL